jgi:hypothetical protein
MPKKSNRFDMPAARRTAIEQFARAIGVAGTDDFPPFLIAWYWHNPNSKDPTGALMEAARRMHGTITEQQAEAIIEEADSRPKIQDRDQLAKYLRLTYAMRTKLDIRVIGACDVGPRARKLIQKRKRRNYDEARRRAKGMKRRAEYLAAAKSREEEWRQSGMSKRTWYRRRKSPAQVPEPSTTRLRLRKQDISTPDAGNGFAVSVGASTPSAMSFLTVAQVCTTSVEEDEPHTCANGGRGDEPHTCDTPLAFPDSLPPIERRVNGCPVWALRRSLPTSAGVRGSSSGRR